jgi:hypothetical protein
MNEDEPHHDRVYVRVRHLISQSSALAWILCIIGLITLFPFFGFSWYGVAALTSGICLLVLRAVIKAEWRDVGVRNYVVRLSVSLAQGASALVGTLALSFIIFEFLNLGVSKAASLPILRIPYLVVWLTALSAVGLGKRYRMSRPGWIGGVFGIVIAVLAILFYAFIAFILSSPDL